MTFYFNHIAEAEVLHENEFKILLLALNKKVIHVKKLKSDDKIKLKC